MTDVANVRASAPDEELNPKRWIALTVILVAAFMDMLDSTILNVTIPSIQADLGADYAAIQWITAGYQLAFALLLILGGRIGDIFGRKRMFMLGTAGFTAASLACALSANPEMLIAFRLLQGGFAAVMVPQVLAIIHVSFPPQERAKAFGFFGTAAGLAAISGLSLGGLLIQLDLFGLDWRLVFLINVPIGLAGLIIGQGSIRESKAPVPLRLDIIGTILAAVALFLLIFPLVQGRELDWPAWGFVMMALCPVALVVFVLHQRAKTRRDGSPIVVLSLFGIRSFSSALAVQIAFNIGVGIFFLSWTLYLQLGLGWTPMHAGLTSLPFCIATFITSALSYAVLAAKLGRKLLQIGSVSAVIGLASYAWLVGEQGADINSWQMIVPLAFFGAGFGMIMSPIPDIATSEAPPQDAGSASGLVNTNQQLGFAIGTALVTVVFFGALAGAAADTSRDLAPQLRSDLTAASVSAPSQDQIVAFYEECTSAWAESENWSPPPCGTPPAGVAEPAAAPVLAAANEEGTGQTFARTFEGSLWWFVGIMALVFLLTFLLPRKNAALEAAAAYHAAQEEGERKD
ncbi:MFS transporter [Actinocorallia aurea]